MLWKCCTQYASKFGKLSSGHRTGKGQFSFILKKGNTKECSNYRTISLISHTSKVLIKILQARLQQYVNCELPDVQVGFRKGKQTRDQIANICWISKRESSRKTSTWAQKNWCFWIMVLEKTLESPLDSREIQPVHCSMSSSNCCFLTCIQLSQEAGQVVWYSHLFQNFPQFVVIHTAKGFGVVNKVEVGVFLEISCFFLGSNRCWQFDLWFVCLF